MSVVRYVGLTKFDKRLTPTLTETSVKLTLLWYCVTRDTNLDQNS